MISFKPLEMFLNSIGMPKTALKKLKIVSGSTYTIIARAIDQPIMGGISIKTINDICEFLECQPGDIIEYIPDNNQND